MEYPVRLLNVAGVEIEGTFFLRDGPDRDCILILRSTLGEFTARGWNYFDALRRLRQQLEANGWRPVCYGGSRNVYPSGMCCDMGRGLVAYRLALGRQAHQQDLVRVFETGSDVVPVSVDEQEKFRVEWLQSLGESRKERG